MRATILIGTLLLAAANPLAAQISPRADSAEVLLEAARDLEAEGDWDAAQALYLRISYSFAATPAADRARIRYLLLHDVGRQGDGIVELKRWATLYGAGMGLLFPNAAKAEGFATYGLGLVAGGAVGYVAGKGFADSWRPTMGQARAITFGSTWGTLQGLGWAEVMGLAGEDYCGASYLDDNFCLDVASVGAGFGAVVLGGLAGLSAGVLLSRKPISRGVASAVTHSSLWGATLGLAAWVLLVPDDGPQPLIGALIGTNAAVLSTALLAPRWNMRGTRARYISVSGLLGLGTGLGLDLLLRPSDTRAAVAIPFATSILGLAVGAVTSRDSAPSPGPADDAEGPLLGALVTLDRGGLGLGLPMPTPTMLLRDIPMGGTAIGPAASFTLFAVRF